MQDDFPYRDATSSPENWFAITPSDDEDLPRAVRAIWVGTGGDLVLQGKDGNVEPFLNVQSGYLFLASPKRVMEATTAEDLVGQP
jgi:hypothetical protein